MHCVDKNFQTKTKNISNIQIQKINNNIYDVEKTQIFRRKIKTNQKNIKIQMLTSKIMLK